MLRTLSGAGSKSLPALLLLGLTLAGSFPGNPPRAAEPRSGRAAGLLVAFRPGIAAAARAGVAQRLGLEVDPSFQNNHVARIRLGARARAAGLDTHRALRLLRRDPAVRLAEPDYEVRAAALPNDPRLSQLWGLHNTGQTGGLPDADIDWPEAWQLAGHAPGPIVAVLDTGVDLNHPDLRDNLLRAPDGAVVGWDFANNDPVPMDDNGHGTHVAGTLAARANNGIGVVGVCPTARLVPVKFLRADGTGATSDAIRALDFAVAAGARIVNTSWGGSAYSEFLLEAIRRAREAGVLVVASSGNDGANNDNSPNYPASYNQFTDNVLSVAASDARDRLAAFSNYGKDSIDLAAPGAGIVSTARGGGYITMSGTSMAAPHVSGTAALILARYPTLSVSQVRERIMNNVDRPASLGARVPHRRLNAARALVNDTIPPGMPVAFTVSHFASSGLLLSWTSSGDDGNAGTASRYELRYSSTPITPENFEEATPAHGLPEPAPAGAPHEYLLANITPDQDLYVALRAVDKVGNVSQLATIGRIRTPSESEEHVAFFDDVENGAKFLGSSPWAPTAEQSFSPVRSYTDSPGRPYSVKLDTALTQNASTLLAGFVPVLSFQIRLDLETGFDFLYVEVSPDDGSTWTRLPIGLTGQEDWHEERISLARFYGQRVRVRFRLITDEVVTAEGVWLDDIRISGDRLVPGTVTRPQAPSGLVARAPARGRVDLQWLDLSDNESGFKVERRTAGPYTTVAVLGADVTQYTDDSVASNTLYRYRVRAINAGGESSPSEEAEILTIPDPPPPPGYLNAEGLESAVVLSWPDVIGVESYQVKRATTPGGPYLALALVRDATEYLDTAVATGIRYYYVVTSFGPGGESVPSPEVHATPGLVLPEPPTRVRARAKKRRVIVRWKQSASPEVVQNRVYRSRSITGPFELVATVPARTRYRDRKLRDRGVYYYRVTAVDLAGHESPPSEQVSAAVGRRSAF